MLAQVVSVSTPVWEGLHKFAEEVKLGSPLSHLDSVKLEPKLGYPYVEAVKYLLKTDLKSAMQHFHLTAVFALDELNEFFRYVRMLHSVRVERKWDLVLVTGTAAQWIELHGLLDNVESQEMKDVSDWIFTTFRKLGFGDQF